MFLLRFKKVDFLKSAHGTTWGAMAMAMAMVMAMAMAMAMVMAMVMAMAMAMAMVMVMAMGGDHFGLIVLRYTASLFCHH